MSDKLRVAVIGCGRMGQHYAHVYNTLPDTELVAIAEYNPSRRRIVGERFGVKAVFQDAAALFETVQPDIAAVVLPGKFIKDAVLAAVAADVRGVTTDKPIGALLSDADEMVKACSNKGIVFGGGNLQRAMGEVHEAGMWLENGDFGRLTGGAIHNWGGEISGGGCQHISVLRLFAGAEVAEVTAWATPEDALNGDSDAGLTVNGRMRMTNGLEVSIFGTKTPFSGVDVWSDTALVRWDWDPPEIYQGFDSNGRRIRLDRPFTPYEFPEFYYLGSSIRSFIDAVQTGSDLWISGFDLRQALEVAIAARNSARHGNVPTKLPLADRDQTLYPVPYRWDGGDVTDRIQPDLEAGAPWSEY